MEQDKSVTIRVQEELKNFLKRWARTVPGNNGKEATAGRTALETFRDVTESIGDREWLEVVQLAHSRGKRPGQLIGAMIRVALEQERKSKK